MKNKIWDNIQKIRKNSPLVHSITNYVVMNNTANALLACGASPIMAHAIEEIEEMVKLCNCTVINIGTLDSNTAESMYKAMQVAKQHNKPTVLDPVGVGATTFRHKVVQNILSQSIPTIIRGNASEIMCIAGITTLSRGVDSSNSTLDSLSSAINLSKQLNTTISISGEIDFVVNGNSIAKIYNGSYIMERVTGMGCTSSAIHGAALGVCNDSFMAAITANALMGVCGELSAKESKGTGSFQVNFLDKLYTLSKEEFMDCVKIEL